MNVTITGRHMELTDALKAYINNGLEKVRGHFDKVIDVDVVLTVEKHRHIAEINLHANGLRVHSKESSSDMYASVDAVLQKLDKQVRRYRDRINQHQPRHMPETRDYSHDIIERVEPGQASQDSGAPSHRVIKRETLSMKPMSLEEALMQLDLIEDNFLVFFNEDTQQVNVLYTRDDGAYGLIERQY
ncbi:MAG TPA: ribosome-associated translation inhibitor RaiA [Candidatus Hydrogenedentes bacterium]|nr:ribosome-associated translation inhibitor RaiA [Candidatus Hydrogenedentota bacterium]HPG69817.1 ribosome-associated translation inhibitor RaiA [Candidatus Hydrogenedentota bacterium]